MNAHVESRSNEGDAAASSIKLHRREKIKNKRRLIVMAGVRWASGRIRIFRPPQTTSHAARLGGKPLFFL